MDDAALTRSLRTGTDSAVESLFDRFAPSLYSYCLTLLSTPDSVAEAVGNTLLAAVDRVDGLADPPRLKVWLFALARNECLRILRRSGRRLPGADILDGVRLRLRLPGRRDRDQEGGLAEIHELIRRHLFDDRAVAAVLGISPWHAKALARRSEAGATSRGRAAHRRGAAALPDGLRERVLVDAAEPVRTMYRGELAGPFRRSGFPVPLDRPGQGRRRILAVAAVALLAVGAALSPSLASDQEIVLTVGEPIDGPLPEELLPAPPATSGPPASATPTATTTPASPTPTPSAPASAKPGPAAPTPSAARPPAPRPPAPPAAPRIPAPATGVITGIGGGCVEVVNGGGIELLSCDGTSSQQWTVAGDGTIHAFRSCMNVRDGGTANGTSVNLSKCNGSGAQRWLVGANGSLINPQSGKCLDGPNNSSDPRQLVIWACDGGAHQRWTLPG